MVVTIIGLLISLLLPAVQSAREAARRATCLNNLRQIGIGLHSYHEALQCFPTGCSEPGRKQIAWSVFLLPYIEQENVHALFHFDKNYWASVSSGATHRIIAAYICPSTNRLHAGRSGSVTVNNPHGNRNGMACTDYGGMYGWSDNIPGNGAMIYDRAVSLSDVRDGASNTILVAEDAGRGWECDGEWSNGQNIYSQTGRINIQDNEMWSDHPGGVHAAFCDGSAHFLSERLSVAVVKALCTRDGEEVIDGRVY